MADLYNPPFDEASPFDAPFDPANPTLPPPRVLRQALAARRAPIPLGGQNLPAPPPAGPSLDDLTRQISERMSARPDETKLIEYAKQRDEKAQRDFQRGMVMQVMGGSAFQPIGAQVLKQALAEQGDYEIPGGWGRVHQGGVVWNPEKENEAKLAHLLNLYKIKQEAQTRSDTAAQLKAYRDAMLAQGKYIPIKDAEGNVTAVVDARTGQVVNQGGAGAGERPDVLPKNATVEEKNRYGNAAEMINVGGRLISEIENSPDAFGLATGAASQLGAATGIPAQKMFITPEQEQLRAGVMQKAYEVINKLAGAALSATEAGRIMQFVPNPRDDAETIKAKLKSAIQMAHDSRNTLRQRYRVQGPEPGPTQRPPSALPKATAQQRAQSYYGNEGGATGNY